MIVPGLSANQSETLKTRETTPFTPSLDTDQQVDIKSDREQREFQTLSRRRSERLRLRTPNKREIVQRLHNLKHADAEKLAKCCSTFRVVTCGQHTVKSYPTFRCKKSYCPDCAADRARRLAKQTEAKISQVMKAHPGARLCLLTLTQRNAKSYGEGLKRLKKDFARFKRRKDFRAHVKGYIGAFEQTYNPKTNDFHVHLHLIVVRGKFWTQANISDAWRETTGDSFVVDIREVKDIHAGAKEIAKYIVKSSDLMKMPDEKFKEVLAVKKGTRMFITGGCFYNLKLDDLDDENADESDVFRAFEDLREGDCCPFCKEQLFDVFVNRDSAIGLYELNAMPRIVSKNSS